MSFFNMRHLWVAMLLFAALPAHAASVQVTDSAGEPLAEAVVKIQVASVAGLQPEAGEIIQHEATFQPRVLTIPTGSQVSFPNQDITRHHVYSFSPAKVFDLNLYLNETPPPVTFDQAGVVVLGCNIHDHMQAFIIVTDASHVMTTDASGQVEIADLPSGEHQLRIWHPGLHDSHQQWWEGSITAEDSLSIALELRASPPPEPEVSSLQQRFREANQAL